MLWLQSFFDNSPPAPVPVNPWSLRKSTAIKLLLIQLVEQMGDTQWRIDTTRRSNADGIYLSHPVETALRAYLHVHGQQAGRAGLHLEYPPVDGNGARYEAYEDLRPGRLADMLAAHFG